MPETTNPTTPPQRTQGQVTPVGAGIAGAIAGAALGAAAAVALSDADTRRKVQKNIKVLKDKVIKVMDSLEEADKEDRVAKKIEDVEQTIEEKTSRTTDQL